jgi:uncharacterized protein YukE
MVGQQQDILALEIMSLEEQLADLNQGEPRQQFRESLSLFQEKMNQFSERIHELSTQIEAKNKTYEETYGENIEEYKTRFEISKNPIPNRSCGNLFSLQLIAFL